jgi:CO dehydrogenase/acetyl-CoA synthase beta subunit
VIGLQFMLRDQHPDVLDGIPSGAAGPATALNTPSGFYYGVTKQYTRSIAWLKAKGYYERLVKASQALQSTGNAQGL